MYAKRLNRVTITGYEKCKLCFLLKYINTVTDSYTSQVIFILKLLFLQQLYSNEKKKQMHNVSF